MEGSGRDLTGGTDENYEKTSGQSVSRTRFEHSISRIQVRNVPVSTFLLGFLGIITGVIFM